MNINESGDRIALRALIDKISMLGDIKDFRAQVQLFSEDTVSETIVEGETFLRLEDRKEMALAFEKFALNYGKTYHLNGQQIVEINGNNATGTCYCFITLIDDENITRIKTTIGATYEDEYIRMDGQWLVSKRTGYFHWQDKVEIGY